MKKIVFMGTPLFAVPILKSIFSKGYNIPLVYTQPPSKSNRGHKVSKSPIHKFCNENDLKVRTPENFINLDNEKNILEKTFRTKENFFTRNISNKRKPKELLSDRKSDGQNFPGADDKDLYLRDSVIVTVNTRNIGKGMF